MRRFELMQESVWDAAAGAFCKALCWAFDGRQISLHELPGFGPQRQEAEARLAWGRGQGYSEASLWEYWGQEGGNGYANLRTRPYVAYAESAEEAARLALQGGQP